MTARTPRTMTAEQRTIHDLRRLLDNQSQQRANLERQLLAEREVSRKLAEACQRARDRMYVHQSAATKEAVALCDAALAQYTATPLASSEGLPTDTVPSQGGRDTSRCDSAQKQA